MRSAVRSRPYIASLCVPGDRVETLTVFLNFVKVLSLADDEGGTVLMTSPSKSCCASHSCAFLISQCSVSVNLF